VWTLSQGAANKIDSFERKILRNIFGSTQSKRVWRIRYNEAKAKQSRYTPRRRLGGEEVYLLLIPDLGTGWG
jgi:hypothetical protein